MALNLSNYGIDPNGARTAETSVEGFGGEESEFAKKMTEMAKKQASGGYGPAAAPKRSAFEIAMERMALDQAKNARANAGRGPVPPGHNRFAPADMAPIKYVGGPGIIGGPTMDVMNMTYEQRQKFLPKESDKMIGPDQGSFLKSQSDIAKSQANAEAAKAELFRKAMAGDPAAIARLQEMQ